MRAWASRNPSLAYALLGILACCLSTGPIVTLLRIGNVATREASLDAGIASLQWKSFDVVAVYVFAPACLLPIFASVALFTFHLGKRENDTFPRAFPVGTAIAFFGLWAWVAIDRGYFRLGQADMAMLLIASMLFSAIYWLTAIRPMRRTRAHLRLRRAAIEAME
jgi:hypothetical protein